MNSAQDIEIHEFSTGIIPERMADGSWVSRGFTGQYMNVTLDPIPHEIERSIANKEFAVAEGAFSDRPTMIGRIISSATGEQWSVVALITKGQDEKGRSASLYRFFLAQSPDGLAKILAWVESQQKHKKTIVFNPFDRKQLGQPNTSSVLPSTEPPSDPPSLLQITPFVIKPGENFSPSQINAFAKLKECSNKQPVAWAYNVEALEQPGRFQVILPASDAAVIRIQRALSIQSTVSAAVLDEESIKSAIKGLINSSQVKPEFVQTLLANLSYVEAAIANSICTENFWYKLFDGQGATNALKQKIYSPQMVRLLTLRAVLLPETLPAFLGWLSPDSKNAKNHNCQTSLDFQSGSQQQFALSTSKHISERLDTGIEIVLSKTLQEEIPSEFARWLFLSKGSLWTQERLLEVLRPTQEGSSLSDQNIRKKVLPREDRAKNEQVTSFLEELGQQNRIQKDFDKSADCYKAVAYFYHLSHKTVPTEIFKKADFPSLRLPTYTIWDKQIARKITFIEKIYTWAEQNKLWLVILFALILTPILGLVIFDIWQQRGKADQKFVPTNSPATYSPTLEMPSPSRTPSSLTFIPSALSSSTDSAQNLTDIEVPTEVENKAVTEFDKTQSTIQEIIEEVHKQFEVSDQNIKDAINEILTSNQEELNFSILETESENNVRTAQLRWIVRIYQYQQKNGGQADGILSQLSSTTQVSCTSTACNLLNEVIQKLSERTVPPSSNDPSDTSG